MPPFQQRAGLKKPSLLPPWVQTGGDQASTGSVHCTGPCPSLSGPRVGDSQVAFSPCSRGGEKSQSLIYFCFKDKQCLSRPTRLQGEDFSRRRNWVSTYLVLFPLFGLQPGILKHREPWCLNTVEGSGSQYCWFNCIPQQGAFQL